MFSADEAFSDSTLTRPPTSTITFDSQGGTPIAPITQDEGAAVPAPAAPTKAGYTFTGWSPAVPATMPVNDMTCVAQWEAVDNKLSADVNLLVGRYNTATKVFTPLAAGETIAQNEIIAVRIVPTTDYLVGTAMFVVMFDKTLFTVQGTDRTAFIVNADTAHIDDDTHTTLPGYQGNHYYDFACSGFSGVTTIPDSSWPAGFAAGDKFDVYKAIKVGTQADSSSRNEGYPEVLPGTWLFQFRLKANSNIIVGTDARIWMDARWFRSITNSSVDGYISKCVDGGLVSSAQNTYAFNFDFSEADIELATTPVANPTSTITFDANGGTPTNAPITQDEGTAVTAPADPTRAGYTFTGWSPAVPATMPVDDVTCVAQWTLITSTITFNSAGGSAVGPITQGEGTAVTAPANPTRSGYTFDGWVPAVPATMPVDDVTCVAQWEQIEYTAWFYVDGNVYAMYSLHAADPVPLPPEPTKAGFTFSGWDPAVPATMPVDDLTCVAQWEAIVPDTSTITFNSAGGSAVAPITQGEGTAVTAPADPIRAGYTFAGWVPAVPTTMPVDDVTCVAQWTLITSTITFNSAGGSPVAPITQGEGTTVTAPADPTRAGYTFDGWVPAVPATMPVDDVTCEAQWEIDKADQTITFPPIGDKLTTDAVGLAATASSGLPVSFAVASGHGSINGGTNLTFSAAGTVSIAASQAGDGSYNAAPDVTNTFSVTKAIATVSLSNTNQTYDGMAKSVAATTVPSEQTVDITYNGSAAAPTNAGNYTVIGTVNEAMYQGGTTGTLTIMKANQIVSFPNIGNQLTTNVVTLIATAMSGLSVTNFSVVSGPAVVSGSSVSFTNSGAVVLSAIQDGNSDWNASAATNISFSVTRAVALIRLSNTNQTYDGTARIVTATTVPSGRTVDLTYNGSVAAPTNVGTYAVSATVDDVMYQGSTNGSLVVAKATSLVTLQNLAQTYDGTARVVPPETSPTGLTVNITYDGHAWAPTNAGRYAVIGLVVDDNYQGSTNDSLVVAKADQTITFPKPGDQLVTNAIPLTASATSGLTVGFGVGFGPAIVDGTSLTFTGAGRVGIVGSQMGNANYEPAPNVTNTISVVGIVTNVTPSVGISDGNTAVQIDGLWLGDGSNVTNVTLCGVQAVVVSQAVDSVWVTTGTTNITEAVIGDVRVSSGFGVAVLTNGFTYLALDPPTAFAPTQIMTDAFRANWSIVTNAASYVIDVSTTSNFTSFVTGYENQNVGDSAGTWVTGLADNTWYWYRLRSATASGSQSLNSNVIGVPTGDEIPWPAVTNMCGLASSAGTQEFALDLIFAGSALTYAVTSDAPAVVSAAIDVTTGIVKLTYGQPGTATITITATHPDTGYSVSYVFTVTVAAPPVYSVGDLVSTPVEVYQIVSITNNTLQTASGVMVIVGNLDDPAYVQNRTSVNGDGEAVIEHPQTLLPGASVQVKIVYTRFYGIQVQQNRLATIAAHLVLTPLQEPPPDTAIPSGVQNIWPRTDGTVVIAFETVAGNEYMVQYRDSFAGEWQNAYPCFIATGTVTYWTDCGQPTTHPHPSTVPSRFYQVLSFPTEK